MWRRFCLYTYSFFVKFLTYILPIGLIAFLPASAMLGREGWGSLWALGSAAVLLGLSILYWNHMLKSHTMAEVLKTLVHRPMKEVQAVKNVSFTIEQGEMVAFLGPNGAGKSTTLKMLTGVLHPSSGEVKCLGLVPWKQRKEYVGRIGAVFGQKSLLVWDIPPSDAVYMNKAIYGIPGKLLRRIFETLFVV